jgi:hypothetical protein
MHSTTCIELSLWCCICASLRSQFWLQVCFETSRISVPVWALCVCVLLINVAGTDACVSSFTHPHSSGCCYSAPARPLWCCWGRATRLGTC